MTFPGQLLLGAPVGTTAGWVLGQLAVVYPTDADFTLTTSGASPQSTNNALQVTSGVSLTATRKLIVPLSFGQQYTVQNNTTGGQAITVIGASGLGVTIANGATVSVTCDGINYFSASGSAGGDLAGSYPNPTVVSLAGSSGTTVANSSLIPGIDNTYTVGSAVKRWLSMAAVAFSVFHAAGDANPTTNVGDNLVTWGVGGATTVDTRLSRTGVSVLQLDNASTGAASLVIGGSGVGRVTISNVAMTPSTDSAYTFGSATDRIASISAVTYNVFAASGDSVASTALTSQTITMGAGGSSALDTRLQRTAAHVLTLDNNSTGAATLNIGGTTAYVAISNTALTPNADSAYVLGTATDRLTNVSAVTYNVFASSGDSVASSALTSQSLAMGPGGSTALDTRITRTAAKTLTLDDGAGGTSGVELFVGGTTATQLGITGSGLTFGTGVSAPLITQLAAITDVAAANTTIQSQAAFSVALSGTLNLTQNSGSVTSTVSAVVANGWAIVFPAYSKTVFTVSGVSGTSFTISPNWTLASAPTASGTRVSATTANQPNGSIVADVGTFNTAYTAYFYQKQNGQYSAAIGSGALYLLNTGGPLTPAAGNYSVACDGNNSFFNAPSGQVRFLVNNTIYYQISSSGFQINLAGGMSWLPTISPYVYQQARTADQAPSPFVLQSQSSLAAVALSGTMGLTNGSNSVSTTSNLTAALTASSPVVFSTQPSVTYYVSSLTSSTITLTANYTGVTAGAATASTNANPQLPGTFNTQNGQTQVLTTVSYVGSLFLGQGITFGNQPGVVYILTGGITSTYITLSTAFTGTTNTTNTAAQTTANVTGAPLHLQGGAGLLNGSLGNRGPVRLQLGADATYGTTLETAEIGGTSLSAGYRVLAINQAGSGISTMQLPTGSGDLVTWVNNALTVPTVAPLWGLSMYSVSPPTAVSLSGTFHTTANSTTVSTTSSQANALAVGSIIQFGNQAGVNYTVASVSAAGTTITLSSVFSGTTDTTNTATTSGLGTLGLFSSGIQFNAGQATPLINQAALASTSAGSGSAGTSLSIVAQAGQAATGPSNNGGAGGNLPLLAGPGGTSGSGTAGIGGLITKFCGQAWQQITITASTYSVDTHTTTSDLMIFTDSTSNTVAITLPAPSAGRLIYVKDKTGKAATHNVTISQHSAETIDGASSLTLSKNYDAVLLISDGTNWAIIGEYAGSII